MANSYERDEQIFDITHNFQRAYARCLAEYFGFRIIFGLVIILLLFAAPDFLIREGHVDINVLIAMTGVFTLFLAINFAALKEKMRLMDKFEEWINDQQLIIRRHQRGWEDE